MCVCVSSKLIFKHADKEDFGSYSVSVTNTEGVSSSYDISAEGRLQDLHVSHSGKLHIITLSVQCRSLPSNESNEGCCFSSMGFSSVSNGYKIIQQC